MASASAIRLQIESSLAQRIPSALTPVTKMVHPVTPVGIATLDSVLAGGLPVGAVSELVGPECSGRTAIALSFLAQITQAAKVCAWVDVSNTLDPASAAAAGVDLARLLWVRCGVLQKSIESPTHTFVLPEKYLVSPVVKKGLHGGGCGAHPRTESKDLSQSLHGLLRAEAIAPCCAEPQRRERPTADVFEPQLQRLPAGLAPQAQAQKPWSRIEQALRTADLLLQGGGFSAIVLDMGSLTPEAVSRVPLSTWYRYRAAAEKTQSSILLLTQHPCSKSSAELVLRLQPATVLQTERTIFSGIEPHVEVVRRRFAEELTNVIPLRKSPQNVKTVSWPSRAVWAGRR